MGKKSSPINRVVIVGGFASNHEIMEHIGRALVDELNMFDEFAAFTMYEASTQSAKLQAMATGQTILTHSAGALLLPQLTSLHLKSAHLLAPPYPKSILQLPKQQQDFNNSPYEYDPNSAHDHMWWYYRHLPSICRADGLAIAQELTAAGVNVHVGAMSHDSYFTLDNKYRERIAKSGVDVVEIKRGGKGAGHSAIQNYPAEILREYFAKIK